MTTVAQAKEITKSWLTEIQLEKVIALGLPEIDDRYHIWRVPLCREGDQNKRRFAADRNPLQYKAVPVTEYVLVYRKRTNLLIDWHIRNHPNPEIVAASKIGDEYERTNIWRIQPNTNSKHPPAFPRELADRVISYYSFKGDVVMDPFAGSGTVGVSAARQERRFVLFEINPEYIELMRQSVGDWLGKAADNILWVNCGPALPVLMLFEEPESYNGRIAHS